MHYNTGKKHTLEARKNMSNAQLRKEKMPLETRFWSKVDIKGNDECWEWKARRNHKGYGVFKNKGKSEQAHRIAWKLTHGEIPVGTFILHTCDNPPCNNPSHLWNGTNDDNMKDMVKKNRQAKGEKVRKKLVAEQVIAIRVLLQCDISVSEVAKMYGLNTSTVYDIKHRIYWRHI